MRSKLFLILLSIFLSMTYANAQLSKTIDVTTPGSLSVFLGDDKAKVTSLTLTGTINDADFATIKQMPLLKVLDMLNVDIVNGTIPTEAFRWRSMNLVRLPMSLKVIGSNAFRESTIGTIDLSGCSSLEVIESFSFSWSTIKTGIDFSNCTSLVRIGNQSFGNSASPVTLPKNLKVLDPLSFAVYRGVVTLPSSLESIGSEAFRWSAMSEIKLPVSLKVIGSNAFRESTIGTIDLSGCSSLEAIESFSFSWSTIKTGIDFSNCTSLVRIGNQSFGNSASPVTLPKNLKVLDPLSFAVYRGVVTLPSSLESIGSEAFRWSAIKEILLPASLKSIAGSAFQECGQLTQIISLNPIPPALGANVFNGVNKTTCKLIVPEGSIPLYGVATQWKDFLIYEAPKAIQKISLHYTEDAGLTIKGDYEAVRVGEYYWMSSAFRDEIMTSPSDIAGLGYDEQAYINYSWLPDHSIKRSQIDLWHSRAWMFENSDNVAERLSYFEELKGASDIEKLSNIEKYYGTYHTRIHLDWLWLNAIRLGKNSRVRLLEGENKGYNIWTEPSVQATMQLFAMCGNATRDELKIYLSDQYNETDNSNPVVIKNRSYMTWFDKTIHNDILHLSNGYKPEYINRYGFNLLPTGDRLNNPSIIQLKDHKTGLNVQYNGVKGDFEGLNQKATIAMGNSYAVIHDYPEIVYTKNYHWQPIRFCRALTDEELGYKLYINIQSYPEWESYSFMTDLYEKHKKEVFEVKIEKKNLGETPSLGFYELPKGYLRGFYVQYMIEYPDSTKTMSDLLRISQQNPHIFYDSPAVLTSELPSTRAAIDATTPEVGNSPVSIYPNPVEDILYLDSDVAISSVQIYSLTGSKVFDQNNVESSINVTHLANGTYVLKLQVGDKSYTHKIIKK